MALRWGVATTVQAPMNQVLAFVAHHLDLGASRVWVHLDDPDDPVAEALQGQKGVTVIRCDAAWWEAMGGRPDTHQVRQIKNITRVTRRAALDWIGHFDGDELLVADRPVADILAEQPDSALILRVEPWEALHDSSLSPDIFTAQSFRRQLPWQDMDLAESLYGPQGRLLDKGMLSHTVGKCFFRTGQKEMVARIHGARIKGENVPGGPFHPDLGLLHFHAQDAKVWQDRLAFRLARGAYQYRPAMQAWLLAASDDQVADFYDRIQTARADLLQALDAKGLLRRADLKLRARVQARFPTADLSD